MSEDKNPRADIGVLVGRFQARARVEHGEPIEVAVDVRSLHFFDPETSQGIYNGTESNGKGGTA